MTTLFKRSGNPAMTTEQIKIEELESKIQRLEDVNRSYERRLNAIELQARFFPSGSQYAYLETHGDYLKKGVLVRDALKAVADAVGLKLEVIPENIVFTHMTTTKTEKHLLVEPRT